jgi:geranylgeranyl diphosphate synthase, type II
VTPSTPDDALRRLLADGDVRAARLGPDHARLWSALSSATEGGKRFRPGLVVAAHDALGGREPEAAAVLGAAVELLHTAFVIHDDVIDGDDVRRGRLNVNGTFSARAADAGVGPAEARHLGATAGILAGDLALTTAIRAVATCVPDVDTVDRLLDLFDEALHVTAAGELADVQLALRLEEVSLADVLVMEQRKTSAYSFQLPLQAGAILAGAGQGVVDSLGEVGRVLGIAFQLQDDVQGVFGDPEVTGKSSLSDLREGKHTVLMAHARLTSAWGRVATLIGRQELTEAEAEEVRALLVGSGSRDFVEELASDHLRRARALLEDLGLPPSLVAAATRLSPLPSRVAA